MYSVQQFFLCVFESALICTVRSLRQIDVLVQNRQFRLAYTVNITGWLANNFWCTDWPDCSILYPLHTQEKSRKCGVICQTRFFYDSLEMWANAQRDGRLAEHRWRPLFDAAVSLTPTTRVPCSNAARTRNPLKFAGVPQTRQQIADASRPKFTILWGHVGETLLFNKFFPAVSKWDTWGRGR